MTRMLILASLSFALACAPEEDDDGGDKPAAKKLSITAHKAGDGLGTITSAPTGIECATDCDEQQRDFVIGGEIFLTAEPARDALFAGWSCDVNDGADLRTGTAVDIVAAEPDDGEGTDIVCTAEFRQLHTLLVFFSAPPGNGTLGEGSVTGAALDTAGNPRIACFSDGSGDCESGYFADESETLTAVADPGSEFCGWRLDCAAAGTGPATLTLDDERECEAVFALGACP